MKAKHILWIAVLAILIGLFLRFNSDSTKNLAKQQTETKEKKQFRKEIDSLKYVVSQYKDTTSVLEKSIEKYKSKEAKLISTYKPKIEGVKHYTPTDIAKFYQKTYKVPEGVKTTEFGTCLSDTVSKMNIRDVFEKQLAVKQLNVCEAKVKQQVLVIKLKDSTIAKLDTINSKTTKELTKTENALNDCQNKPKEKKNRGLFAGIAVALWEIAKSVIK